MSDPRGFLLHEREEIPRRSVTERLNDWREVDQRPPDTLLKKQSTRCMDCGVPFCQSDSGCPLHNLIPEWNSLVSSNRWQDAAVRLHSTNNFPEFTGRLCPAPCENVCVLGVTSPPVSIKAAEWGIIDKAFENDWVRSEKPDYQTGFKVAVIGSGPAGLTVAQQLARVGHAVTIFEKSKYLGGLLRYGIPDFKMQKELIDRRLRQLWSEGITFRTSLTFGRDILYEDLKKDFNAIVLATGAEVARDLEVDGRELLGIHRAMDFLVEQNRLNNGEITKTKINAQDKHVVILGGGDTGSDCLGTALRQGAKSVVQIEIQPKPLKIKFSHAHEEGGAREWSLKTLKFIGNDGAVKQVRAVRLSTNEELLLNADLVLLALGFTGVDQKLLSAIPGLELNSSGTLKTDVNLMTTVDGVFACGDSRRGASLIVWAIAEGRRLAESIHRYLGGLHASNRI